MSAIDWAFWRSGAAWRATVIAAINEGRHDGLKRRVYRHPIVGWTWDLA